MTNSKSNAMVPIRVTRSHYNQMVSWSKQNKDTKAIFDDLTQYGVMIVEDEDVKPGDYFTDYEVCFQYPSGAANFLTSLKTKPVYTLDVVGTVSGKISNLELIQPADPVMDGLPVTQDPKYGIRDNKLYNRATGEFIPVDEPVFIFRAKDTLAIDVLNHYLELIGCGVDHFIAVAQRIKDFEAFAKNHPERMQDPDTKIDHGGVHEL